MKYLALSRIDQKTKTTEWLVANGHNMGRWTFYFGSPCLADIQDCKAYVQNMNYLIPGSMIHKFELTEVPVS